MWMSAALPAFLGVLFIFVPGFLVAAALRVKGFDAVAIAPPISVALIALSAVLAPSLGWQWALWVPFAFAIALALVAFGLGFLGEKLGFADAPHRRKLSTTIERSPMTWNFKAQLWFYVSVALGSVLAMRNVARSVGDPAWIAQTWDVSFHLNAVRFIANTGNASSLFIASMTSGDKDPEFYPAAWHDIVSLVFMHTDASIPVATNAVALVVAGIVWPLSVVYMVRSIFSARPLTLLIAGIAAASISAFPFSLLYFGILYPNLLGYALLPVGIGMMAQLFRVGLVRYLNTLQAAFLGIFVALGTAFAHPNAVMSLLVLVIPIFVTRIVLQVIAGVKKETPWWVVLLQVLGITAIFVVISILWDVVRPPREAGEMWGPTVAKGQALGELAFNQTLQTMTPLWVVTALSFIGIFFLVTCRNRLYWVFGLWLVLAYFYVAVRTLGWDEGRYDVVGVWYHDSFRLAALAPIAVIIFIAYGIDQLSLKVLQRFQGRETFTVRSKTFSKASALATLAGATVLVLGFLMQSALPLNNYIQRTRTIYEPSIDSELLTLDEYDVLLNLDRLVPEDEAIIVSPFTGASLAYALSDREVSAYHTIWQRTDEENYIYQNLDKAQEDPKVCELLEEENLRYYLWFGWDEINNDGNHAVWYPSFERLWETEGVIEPLYRTGGATLYEIVACD